MSPRLPAYDYECTLLRRVRALLADSDQTNLQLYAATGLRPGWLDSVRKGTTKSPSVNRVQYLYEYLTAQKLRVQ